MGFFRCFHHLHNIHNILAQSSRTFHYCYQSWLEVVIPLYIITSALLITLFVKACVCSAECMCVCWCSGRPTEDQRILRMKEYLPGVKVSSTYSTETIKQVLYT